MGSCRLAMLLPVLVSVSCSPSSADGDTSPTVERWSVEVQPRLRIGVQDGEAPYLFDRISAVRVLENGGVVVADRGSATIRIFDATGGHRLTMGGPGSGPGEFRWLRDISILPPDTILAYDGSLFRLTWFLTDGTLVATRTLRPADGSPELYLGTYSNGDVAAAWIAPAPREPGRAVPDLMRVGRFGADGALISVLGTLEGMRRMGPGPVPFSPFLHAALLRDSVFFTDGREPALMVLGADGATARSIAVPLSRPDRESSWDTLRATLAAQGSRRLDDFPEAAALEPVPSIAEVLFDAEGRFWLKQYDPATDSYLARGGPLAHGGRWSVVSPEGQVIAEIDFPRQFAPVHVGARHVAGVYRSELGVEEVWVFDFRR